MNANPSKKLGRPTKLTPQLKEEICERIAYGESLAGILKSDPKFPTYPVIMGALKADEEFLKMYARAREDQADYLADEILEIADTADAKNSQAVRVRVDARKWIASKLRPRKYGDRIHNEVSGPDGGPIAIPTPTINPREMTDEELDQYLAKAITRKS
jgi:hypothetical protein